MADIQAGNAVSTDNSTATPLGISGVFTGTAEEVSEYGTISVGVFADVASATDGLSIQFSTDGTNWDHIDTFTIPSSTGKIFTVGPSARYYRVVYTNGTTAQASFRLQSVFKLSAPKPSSHRIQDSISTNDDAELVKAILSGEDITTGDFVNIEADNGRLIVSQDPVAPPASTPVIINEFNSVDSTTGVDTYYTITSGDTLTIQQLSGGAEAHTSGSIIELFYDPDADLGVNLDLIETVFVNGDSQQVSVGQSFTGDGTARIVLRRRRYAANAKEMWGRWIGFEQ
jgi:hypothetical protein